MVVLVTDNDASYELQCPGTTLIGRGSQNDVVPESRSISKSHAILTLQMKPSGKIEVWLEDLNSTNGTYVGSSPLEIHKISGKECIAFGDYVRFGHSIQYYRLLESALPSTGRASLSIDKPITFFIWHRPIPGTYPADRR
jgi:pSer/pThr/pTyr-binding forkhead associated (FHA) protein